MPACARSFSMSLIDFPKVADLAVALEDDDGAPRDMDHRSSNPDKPLPAGGGEAGVLFDIRETGVDLVVVVLGESGCDDDQSVFCAGVGDIEAAKVCDGVYGLLLPAAESGLSGALKTGGEVDRWAGLKAPAPAPPRFDGGEVLSISIRVTGRAEGGEAGVDGEGAAWKSAKSSSVATSACETRNSKGSDRRMQSRKGVPCWSWRWSSQTAS